MPITTQEIANKRNEQKINKLIDIIDKKLQEHNTEAVFKFTFLPQTPTLIQKNIQDVYREAGWYTILEKNVLTLENIYDQFYECTNSKNVQKIIKTVEVMLGSTSIARNVLVVEQNQKPQHNLEENAIFINQKKETEIYTKNTNVQPTEICCSAKIKNNPHNSQTPNIETSIVNSFATQENILLIKLLKKAQSAERTINTYAETIDRAIEDSEISLSENRSKPAYLIMSPQTFIKNKKYLENLKEPKIISFTTEGYCGKYKNMDVYTIQGIENGFAYVLPYCTRLGTLEIKQNIYMLPSMKTEEYTEFIVAENLTVSINPEFVNTIIIK